MPPEVRVTRLLTGVVQRLRWQGVARAVSAGAAAGLIPFLVTRRVLPSLVLLLIVAMAHWWLTRRTRQHPAVLVESRVPACRNVLVTAEALLSGKLHAKPQVTAVVLEDASRRADEIVPSDLWPWTRPAIGLVLVLGSWVFASLVPITPLGVLVPGASAEAAAPAIDQVNAVVTPPAYTGRAAATFSNPERIILLAGSSVRVTVASSGAAVSVETGAVAQQAVRGEDGLYSADLVFPTDGYLALTPVAGDGRSGARRLIGVTALPDRAPEIRITEPGKDLFLRSSATRPLQVQLQAEDDLGLRTVRLAYTKVAGAGESFTFTEGEAAIKVTRQSDRQWTATGVVPIDTMSLDVGDMVVYRGVAIDSRPGSTPVESDAFIVEIVSASDAMAEGFSIDERQDKYALSQQMVILKTERLIARKSTLSNEALIEQALGIAAEQRSVRAEIVFMMGGEFEDEEVEAEHEHELAEGRGDNSGRADLGRATRAMSRAASQLTDLDLTTALASERTALVAMQRALSRRRFILRTLTQRGQIDDSRRLQGRLAGLGRGQRTPATPPPTDLVTVARSALRTVMDVAKEPSLTSIHAVQLSAAAAKLLATDGRGAPVVDVATRLTTAADAIAAGTPDVAHRALADATTRLIAIASAELALAPALGSNRAIAELRGALADALRAGGGR